jgi:outer membrane protein TolC
MVGPDYLKPSAPMTLAYKEAPPPGDGWKIARPSDQIRGNWWEIFGDPQLNALAEQVAIANQDLKVAEARLREARA